MHTVLSTTETAGQAKRLAEFLSNVKFVKSVSIDNGAKEKYNWTNPSRPATDEEFEQLAIEMENDKGEYTPEQVMNHVKKEIKSWKKKKK